MTRRTMPHSHPGWRVMFRGAMICGMLWAAGSAGAVVNYTIRNWQNEDGLPQNSVTALQQTRDGYLWVGTLAGLVRFDGDRFVVFDTHSAPELKNGRITALYEDDAGVLWIGHETGHLTRLERGSFTAVDLPPAWNYDVVSHIARDDQGDLWIHSRMGRLARLRDGLVIPPGEGVIDGYGLSAMASESSGKLWVTRGGQLHHLREGQLQVVQQAPATPTNFVHAFCARGDGGLWVVRGGRIYSYVDHEWQPAAAPTPDLFTVTRLLETRTRDVIIGTIDRGLWLVSPEGVVRNLNRTNGLSAHWVSSLIQDREGNLWVGSANGGLNVLCPTELEVWHPPDHWNGMPVLSVCRGQDDAVWVGTEGAGIYRLSEGRWRRFGPELASKFVWAVASDLAGRIWAGTWGGGLLVRSADQFVVPPGAEGLKMPITAILHGSNDVVWLGTRSGLIRYHEGVCDLIGPLNGAAAADVRAVAEDVQGAIWFGMMGGGLGCLSNGIVRQYRMAEGLPSDFILALHFDERGALWIGTSGGGLCRFQAGRFAHIGTRHGLPSSTVLWLQKDAWNYYWLSTANGIFRVSADQLNQCADGVLPRVAGITYGTRDGLPTTECSGGFQPAGCQTQDGRIWFPTRKGLVSIRPNEPPLSGFAPAAVIEDVWVDGRKVWGNVAATPSARASLTSKFPVLSVPPGVQRFEVAYTGLGLSHPERLRFRYRLEGLDLDWVEAGRKRSASYSHPPPGKYIFRVQVSDYEGNWTRNGDALWIQAQPFFWQTWWFQMLAYVGCAGGVAVSVWFAARRRQRRKLESMARQQELERERTRIARDIHDDLGASLTRISMLSQPNPGELQAGPQPLHRLDLIYDTTRELIRAMDEIVWAVNPEHDTLDSVATYLARFAQAHLIPAGIRCRLHLPIEVPASRVRAETRHNLFLAFKEALHNILKHAQASEVRFSLEPQGGLARFCIEDNGVGLAGRPGGEASPAGDRIASGQGTGNMQQRLAAVGGSCLIIAGRAGGTAVYLSIPVDALPARDAEPFVAARSGPPIEN